MNEHFGFGQPKNSVIQYAYIVPDIQKAMRQWTEQLGVGPWYIAENFGPSPDAFYRGEPSKASFDIALAFSGHAQIELIQMKDDQPSVFKEMLDRSGTYGFHHFGKATTHFDMEFAKLQEQGYEVAFTDKAPPNGNRIAYLTQDADLPGMIELIEADDGLDQVFTKIFQAGANWHGTRLVRPFTELFS